MLAVIKRHACIKSIVDCHQAGGLSFCQIVNKKTRSELSSGLRIHPSTHVTLHLCKLPTLCSVPLERTPFNFCCTHLMGAKSTSVIYACKAAMCVPGAQHGTCPVERK
jgi:hypothetical protein